MTEKRQTYTAEFKREAVRLVTEHGYGGPKRHGIWGSMPIGSAGGNANVRHKRMGCFQAKDGCHPTTQNSTACVKNISVCAWSGRC